MLKTKSFAHVFQIRASLFIGHSAAPHQARYRIKRRYGMVPTLVALVGADEAAEARNIALRWRQLARKRAGHTYSNTPELRAELERSGAVEQAKKMQRRQNLLAWAWRLTAHQYPELVHQAKSMMASEWRFFPPLRAKLRMNLRKIYEELGIPWDERRSWLKLNRVAHGSQRDLYL